MKAVIENGIPSRDAATAIPAATAAPYTLLTGSEEYVSVP
jgi:hypothetical protein